jgi:hypothetical protein
MLGSVGRAVWRIRRRRQVPVTAERATAQRGQQVGGADKRSYAMRTQRFSEALEQGAKRGAVVDEVEQRQVARTVKMWVAPDGGGGDRGLEARAAKGVVSGERLEPEAERLKLAQRAAQGRPLGRPPEGVAGA